MITLKDITLREIALPLREPFRISSGVESTRRILLLHLQTKEGLETWSECVAGALPNYCPETIDTAWLAIRAWLAPKLLGQTIEEPSQTHKMLEQDVRGHNMAKAALEMAVWELFAQNEGVSLARLIGGSRNQIATGISLGIQCSPHELVGKVEQAFELGYQRVKMKIRPGADIDFIGAVREKIGDEPTLMADANNAYTLDDIETLLQLDEFNLAMIEQPLAWDDIFYHRVLQSELKTPICLDESITNLTKAKEMHTHRAGKIINLKPGRVGGFLQSLLIHDFCGASGIPLWCGGMLESGVGRAYNVALASLPNFVLPGDISPSRRYWEQDICAPEWTMDKNGMVQVPMNKTGLGIEVNTDFIESLTVRTEALSQK